MIRDGDVLTLGEDVLTFWWGRFDQKMGTLWLGEFWLGDVLTLRYQHLRTTFDNTNVYTHIYKAESLL